MLRGLFPVVAALVLTVLSGTALGQNFNRSVADTSTPLGMQKGSSEISVYNGAVNYSVPVLDWKLRGGMELPLTVPVRTPRWTIFHIGSQISGNGVTTNDYYPQIDYLLYRPDNGAYMVYGRRSGIIDSYIGYISQNIPVGRTITKLNFLSWNGQEVELTDEVTKGQPASASGYDYTSFSRGTVFASRDGSNIRFVSDTVIQDALINTVANMGYDGRFLPSGFLTMPDGSTHRYDLGRVTWIRDRNGNQTSFSYDSTTRRLVTITDPIGRTINFAYNGGAQTMTYKGVGGVTRTVTIQYAGCQSVLRSDFTPNTPIFSGINTVGSNYNRVNICNANVISWIELPNGQRFNFRYTPYGDLARVELPTGGAYEYDYGTGSGLFANGTEIAEGDRATPGNNVDFFVYRPVKVKRVYNTGNQLESTLTLDPGTGVVTNGSAVVETVKDAQQTVVGKTLHKFYGNALMEMAETGLLYNRWTSGREYETQVLNTVTSSPIEITSSTWTQTKFTWDSDPNPPVIAGTGTASNNPVLTQTTRTISDGNLVSKQTYTYDADGNRITTNEYGFGVGVSASLPYRTMEMTYLVNDPSIPLATRTAYRTRNLLSLMTSMVVKNAGGTIQAQNTYTYDDSDLPTYNYGGAPTGWVSPGVAQLGNSTRTKRWLDTAGTWVELKGQFDQFGNVVKSWDELGRLTETDYSPTYQYAYATQSRLPIADATGTQGANTAFTTTAVYDFDTGLPTTTTDANGQVSTIEYNDTLDRMTAGNPPTGGPRAEKVYGDTPGSLFVKTRVQTGPGTWGETTQYLDGLGRQIRTEVLDGTGNVYTDTQYDSLGRVVKVSNPYRIGDTLRWTTTAYDTAGRVASVTTPDGAVSTTTYTTATTGTLGQAVTVTDPAGRVRRTLTDAFGRLVRTDEPDTNGQLGTLGAPNQASVYAYSVLDKLTTVTQGVQIRTFTYDSLGRQLTGTVPESGTLSATYDLVGNVLTQTDERGVLTTTAYDALNRPVQRSYTTAGGAASTSTVTFYYDGKGLSVTPNYAKGQLTKVINGNASYEYRDFDTKGNVTSARQIIDGNNYDTSYTYNLSGALVSETYPSGRVVTATYATDGRLLTVTGRGVGQSVRTYATNFTYAASGQVTQFQYGNGLWEEKIYNTRLQLTGITLRRQATTLWNVAYDYGTTDNSGLIKSQSILHPGITQPLVQTYTYDSLNRLMLARETQNAVEQWKQTFAYDRFGNRSVTAGQTTVGMVGPNPTISATNSRIAPQAGEQYLYDVAGNLIADKDGKRFAFDGDNKVVSVAANLTNQTNGVYTAEYRYDAAGRRVKKIVGSVTTLFVYDAFGELVAEYTVNGPSVAARTQYLTQDTLGSPRVITDGQGQVTTRRDFAPYGEDLGMNATNRQSAQGYANAGDLTKQKFTGYERDDETGLDFAQARYYDAPAGRFRSADPLQASAVLASPQTFNRYAYVSGNPVNLTDPTGLFAQQNPPKKEPEQPQPPKEVEAPIIVTVPFRQPKDSKTMSPFVKTATPKPPPRPTGKPVPTTLRLTYRIVRSNGQNGKYGLRIVVSFEVLDQYGKPVDTSGFKIAEVIKPESATTDQAREFQAHTLDSTGEFKEFTKTDDIYLEYTNEQGLENFLNTVDSGVQFEFVNSQSYLVQNEKGELILSTFGSIKFTRQGITHTVGPTQTPESMMGPR